MIPRRSLIIAIDFDGCIVEHDFPRIGAPVPGAEEVIRLMIGAGHRPILWTCRSNYHLLEAIDYVRNTLGLDLHGWNSNRLNDEYPGSPKLYADTYIDDKGLGCPLVFPPSGGRPYVNWPEVRQYLIGRGVLPVDLG